MNGVYFIGLFFGFIVLCGIAGTVFARRNRRRLQYGRRSAKRLSDRQNIRTVINEVNSNGK
jgi:alpha-tubulin suppressor-like RCC1 family protein